MEKGREANENILMEEKYHGMRKVRVLRERKFKRTNLCSEREKKQLKPKHVAAWPFH